jgi:hypothetical protein
MSTMSSRLCGLTVLLLAGASALPAQAEDGYPYLYFREPPPLGLHA